MKVSVILPTYNEKKNIKKLVDSINMYLNKIPSEIIIVDDFSPDETWKEAKEIEKNSKNVRVFIRKKEKGLATAIRYGIEKSNGDIIVVMDTDFSHSPGEIPILIEEIKNNYDIVIASRWIKGGKMISNTKLQIYFSRLLNIVIGLLLGLDIKDLTNGFFAAKRSIILDTDLDKIFKNYGDYFFVLMFKLKNAKIKEIPSIYQPRLYGQSKTKLLKVGLLYLKEVFKIRINKF